jgi:hypothetical protein
VAFLLISKYYRVSTKLLTQGKSSATINRHLTTLKHMFTKAVEWEMVDQETMERVRRVKLLPENNRRLLSFPKS